MEAIAEMLGAIIVAILELMMLVIQAVAALLAILLELAFTALFYGVDAARKKYQERKLAGATTPSENPEPESSENSSKSRPFAGALRAIQNQNTRLSSRVSAVQGEVSPKVQWTIAIFMVLFIGGSVFVIWYQQKLTQQRVDQTKKQISLLADQFAGQIALGNPVRPPGQLPDQDAWGQPCELFVDDFTLATMIVVRSWGPDCRHGTIDDQLAVRVENPPLKILGRRIGKVGLDFVQKRIQKLFPGKQLPPEKIDIKLPQQ